MDPVISQPAATDIAFFLQNLEGGGAERAIAALAGEIAKQGYAVDLVLGNAKSDYHSEISSLVRVEDFATNSSPLVFRRLIKYLNRRNPRVVMSALDAPNIMLVVAAAFAGYKGRTVVSQRAVVDASHRELGAGARMVMKVLQRLCFARADAVISNSHAAANEIRSRFGIPAEKVFTIHNALDAGRITYLSDEQVSDPFFVNDRSPLIVSVGSLTKRKDMETLVRAFALVKAQRSARLVIVGKGAEREKILSLVSQLGLAAHVHLPGFDANPYKWMRAAAIFVSSSTGEGFPNVVAEALALSKSIVATDCPGDTAVILGHGKWGRLVPVGDSVLMAHALLEALSDPNPPDLRIRAADFAPSKITSAYLNALLPKVEPLSGTVRNSV